MTFFQVCTPQFNHKFVHAEKMYVPRFMQLGLEADQYPGKKRLDQAESTTTTPAWKQHQPKSATTAADEDAYSSRYRRRQQLEEQAWNRIRVEQENGGPSQGSAPMRRSPRSSGVDEILSGASPNSRGGNLEVVNPWIRAGHRAASDLTPEAITVVAGAGSSSPISIQSPPQQPRPKPQSQQRAESAAGAAASRRQLENSEDNRDRDLDQRVANIRKEYERRQQDIEDNLIRGTQKRVRNRTTPVDLTAGDSSEEEEEDEEDSDPQNKIAVQMFPKPGQVQVQGEKQDKQPAKSQQQSVAASRPLHVDTNNDASTSRVSAIRYQR